MSDSKYEKQLSDARLEHSRISPNVDGSLIVLSKPVEKIYHRLHFREQTAEELAVQNNKLKKYLDMDFYSLGDAPIVSAARDYYKFGIPYLDANERLVNSVICEQAWGANANFGLLKEFLVNGLVPSDTFDHSGVEPLPHHLIMEKARADGYKIPDKFLEPKKVRDDKRNALYAANDLKSRQIHFAEDNQKNQMITSIKAGFLIPDPDEDWRVPIVLDQLWIIQEENAQLRFIAVEIVSSLDQTKEKNEQGRTRSGKMARQGIELFRVSGAWCRIDSWRALSEVLYEADVFPSARGSFGYPELNNINDYVCFHCEQPMIRFDSYWVEKCSGRYDNDDFVPFNPARYMHPKCAGEVIENY